MAGSIYEYTGVVEAVLEKQTFPSGFYKQDIVLTDPPDSGARFPNHLAFTFKKDNCALLANARKGQTVKIRFALDGRAWQDPKSGTTRYFTDLTGLRLEAVGVGGDTSVESMPDASMPGPAEPPADIDLGGDPDDIPF